MAYYIPSLHKGLVDGSAKGKLTEDYKSKCTVLENAYVKSNQNIATRPPLEKFEHFDLRTVTINDITSNTGNYFIHGETTMKDIADDHGGENPVYYSQIAKFFNELQRRNGEEGRTLTLKYRQKRSRLASSTLLDNDWNNRITHNLQTSADCKLVNVYDDKQNLQKEQSYLFCKINVDYDITNITTQNITTSGAAVEKELSNFRIRNLSQLILLFKELDKNLNQMLSYNPSTYSEPADPTAEIDILASPDISVLGTPYLQQANNCNEAGDLSYVMIFKNPYESFNPIYQGVLNLPQIDENFEYADGNIQSNIVDAVNNPGKPSSTYGFGNENTLSLIDVLSDFYVNGPTHSFFPHLTGDSSSSSFEKRDRGAGFRMFGADYTITGDSLTCDQSGGIAIFSSSTEDRNMQKYTEKVIDRNIDTLPILAASFPTYNNELTVAEVKADSSLTANITLQEWNRFDNNNRFLSYGLYSYPSINTNIAGSPLQYYRGSINDERYGPGAQAEILAAWLGGDYGSTSAPQRPKFPKIFYKVQDISGSGGVFDSSNHRNYLVRISGSSLRITKGSVNLDYQNYPGSGTLVFDPVNPRYQRITDIVFYTPTGLKQYRYTGTAAAFSGNNRPDSVTDVVGLYTEIEVDSPFSILNDRDIDFGTSFIDIGTSIYQTTRSKTFEQEPLTLNELITRRPELSRLKEKLKLSMTILNQNDGETKYPKVSRFISALPDIKITLPGSDISAEGSFLFSTVDGSNVFVGASSPITYKTFDGDKNTENTSDDNYSDSDQKRFDEGEDPIASPKSPFLSDSSNSDRKNTGSAMGSLGVTLYIQRGNPVTKNGIPIYCPIPAPLAPDLPEELNISGAGGSLVNTLEVIVLMLDYSDASFINTVNEMNYVSFYSSAGKERANTAGMIKLHDAKPFPNLKEELSAAYSYKGLIKKMTASVDGNIVPFILEMSQLVINLDFQALKYVANDLIEISDDTFPTDYISDTTGTIASVKSTIERLEGEHTFVRWLGNDSVNNVFYPQQQNPNSIALETKKLLEKAVDRVEKIRGRLLVENSPQIGKLIHVDRYDLPAPTNFSFRRFGYECYAGFHGERGEAAKSLKGRYCLLWEPQYEQLSSTGTLPNNISRIDFTTTNAAHIVIDGRVIFTVDRGGTLTKYPDAFRPRRIIYESIYTYKNTDPVPYTDPITGDVLELTRHNIGGYLQSLKEALEEITVPRDRRLINEFYRPYSTFFKVYNSPIDVNNRISGRLVQVEDDKIYLSSRDQSDVFTLGWKEFWRNCSTVLTTPGFIRRSGIPIEGDYQLSRQTTEPSIISVPARVDSSVELAGVTETEDSEILITNQGLYRIIEGSSVSRISRSGFTSQAISNTSMLIGANGEVMKVVLPSEEAQGFLDFIVNDEYTFEGNIDSVVDLVEKYKLIFFTVKVGEEYELYTLSIGKDRRINGFSRFTFPENFKLQKIFKLTEERLLLATEDLSTFFTLDFNSNYRHKDLFDYKSEGETEAYNFKVRPMPIIKLTETNFSANKSQVINKAIIGMSGNPNFKFSILNSIKPNQKAVVKHYRQSNREDITEPQTYSGFAIIEGIPANGCEIPEIEISKNDGRYLEISSIALLGKL